MSRYPNPERFWTRVERTTGCWLWRGYIAPTGYGRYHNRKAKGSHAHRVAWEMAHGPIPDGLFVCHHCDNPICVKTEPDETWPDGHLFLGTARDNVIDMHAKGRAAPNPRYRHVTTTREQRDEIRRRHDQGEMVKVIADDLGLGRRNTGCIANRRTWRVELEISADQVVPLDSRPAATAAAGDVDMDLPF